LVSSLEARDGGFESPAVGPAPPRYSQEMFDVLRPPPADCTKANFKFRHLGPPPPSPTCCGRPSRHGPDSPPPPNKPAGVRLFGRFLML